MLATAILKAGSEVLQMTAEPITNFNTIELDTLIVDLFQKMKAHDGAGIAAPQVGISKRLFVYGITHNKRYPEMMPIDNTVLINPEILWLSLDTTEYYEGCLSIPNIRGIVPRSKEVLYTAYLPNGKKIEKTAYDFEARIIQHELDHLNGVLFLSRVQDLRTVKYVEE